MHRSRLAIAAPIACAMPAGVAAQDNYPGKVIRIVTSSAGGNSDVLARFVATGMSATIGQQVIVDNRGALAPAVVAKAPPDGYTLHVNGPPLLPAVPTMVERGVAGYESISPQGVFAPAKTPPAIVDRLQKEIARALKVPELKDRLTPTGVQVVASTPEAFAAAMRADIDRTAKLIKVMGIREEK